MDKINENVIDEDMKQELSTAAHFFKLADVNLKNGQFENAVDLYSEALPCFIKVYGEIHEKMIAIYYYLSIALSNNKEWEKSNGYIEKLLECLYKRDNGNDSKDTASCHSNLAANYQHLNQIDKTIEHYTKSKEIYISLAGEEDDNSIAINTYLTTAYFLNKEFETATKLQHSAIDYYAEHKQFQKAAVCYMSLGAIYSQTEHQDLEVKLYHQALTLLFSEKQANMKDIETTFTQLAIAHTKQKQNNEAIKAYEGAFAAHKHRAKAENYAKSNRYKSLVVICLGLVNLLTVEENYVKAIEYQTELIHTLEKFDKENIKAIVECYNQISLLHTKAGHTKQAKQMAKKALAIQNK